MAFSNFGRCLIKLSNAKLLGIRFYSRWTHRRPSRVLLQSLPTSSSSLEKEEIFDLNPQDLQIVHENTKTAKASNSKEIKSSLNSIQQLKQPPKNVSSPDFEPKPPSMIDGEKIKQKRSEMFKRAQQRLEKQIVFNEEGELVYHTLKDNDGRVSTLLTNLKSKNGRSRTNQVLVEGWRLIVDGLQANCKLNYIIFSRVKDLEHIKPYLPQKGVNLFRIPYKEISMWSSVDTSSGLLGVFEMPQPEKIKRMDKPLPLQIICDNVRDPGNLGAILRASVGVGCTNVLLMKGCVDLWESKVIRSAAGAHFRLPIHKSLEWSQINSLVNPTSSILIADNNFKIEISNNRFSKNDITEKPEDMESLEGLNVPVIPYYSMDYSTLDSITLIIGGETEGISEDSYRFAAERNGLRVNIPLQKGVDSLNTGMATAVIAFEIKKQILDARAQKKRLSQ